MWTQSCSRREKGRRLTAFPSGKKERKKKARRRASPSAARTTHVGPPLEVEPVRGLLVLLLDRHLKPLGGAEGHAADDGALGVGILSKVGGKEEGLRPALDRPHAPAAVRLVEAIPERVALAAAKETGRVGPL